MRREFAVASLVAVIVATTPQAQSVRGIVVDDSTKLPVAEVLITLIAADGGEHGSGVRSDDGGNFTVHASRPGTYRVRAVRIGFRPLTSDPVSLGVAQVAIMRLRMTTLAQPLIPVRIVERRTLTAAELMSVTGFDLRRSKGLGTFLGPERLAAMGYDGVREVLGTQLRPTLFVETDSSAAGTLRIRQGLSSCIPEVFLDGRLLAGTPEQARRFDSAGRVTLMDSIRFQGRLDVEAGRVIAAQEYALSVLSTLRANNLHGVEVYRANQTPPASLGGWFGTTRRSVNPCGTVAIWTKTGTRRLAMSRRSGDVTGVQVISGTVVNLDTGVPIAGVPITLLDDARDPIGDPIESNNRGEFSFRTDRAGQLRLLTANIGSGARTTPILAVAPDEVVIIKLFVSPSQPVLAPLAVAARILPQTYGIESVGGFAYRRERAVMGTFFGPDDLQRSGGGTLAELLSGLPGVIVSSASAGGAIEFLAGDDLPRCRPAVYMDGRPMRSGADGEAAGLPLDRVFGVEVYARAEDVPAVFADAGAECGLVGIWMRQ